MKNNHHILNWEIKSLEDIAIDFVSGGTPSTSKKEYWEGDIHWMRSAHITGKEVYSGEKFITKAGLINSATNLVPKDNLLIATRVSLGNVVINRVDMAISQDLTGIIIDKNKINENFLYYLLLTKKNEILSIAQGTTIKGILRDDLKKFRIYVPPLVEQLGIVVILGTVDECIRLTDEVIGRAEELKRGLMQRLLTRGIGHTEYRQTPLGEIPKTWKIVRLKDISIGGSQNGLYKSTDNGDPINYVRMTELFKSDILTKEIEEKINVTKKEREKFSLKNGDLLFGRRSLKIEGAGKCVLVSGLYNDAIFESSIIRFSLNQEKAYPLFYLYWFLNDTGYRTIRKIVRIVTVSGVTGKDLERLKIPLPPIKEQIEISNIVQICDRKISDEKNRKKKLLLLKQGLMQVLLSGKVRVEMKENGLPRIRDGGRPDHRMA